MASRGVMLVTGGSRGIGAATARLAAAGGWAVCLTYTAAREEAERVVADIGGAGGSARAVRADVTREEDLVAAFDAATALGPLRAAVANAGVVAPKAEVADFTAERVRRIFEVNVVGAILTAREAVRRMSTARGGDGGAVVLLSSAVSRLGSPGEYVDYAATKGAIDTFTLGLGREVATQGVRVNAVRPGLIATEIHASGGQPDRLERMAPAIPMQRAGTAEEVAAAIVWLCGEEAGYVTSALLDVSGGR